LSSKYHVAPDSFFSGIGLLGFEKVQTLPESNFFVNNCHCLKTCSATKVRSFGPIFSVGDQGLGGGGYDFKS
jgi:hypothetical protein